MTKNSLAYDYRSLMRKTMRKMAEAWHFLTHVALLMQAHTTKKSATPKRRAVKLVIGFVAAITTDTFPFLCHSKTPLKRALGSARTKTASDLFRSFCKSSLSRLD